MLCATRVASGGDCEGWCLGWVDNFRVRGTLLITVTLGAVSVARGNGFAVNATYRRPRAEHGLRRPRAVDSEGRFRCPVPTR